MESGCMVKKPRADPVLDFRDCISKLLCDSLPFERFDSIRVCRGRHDDEGDNSDIRSCLLQSVIQSFWNIIHLIIVS